MLRSHDLGALNKHELKKTVELSGWVARLRDHGGVNFVDLRDRWGVTQVVFRPELDKELHKASQALRPEFCIWVKGEVAQRPKGTVNSKLPTGEIEVIVKELRILSRSETPPFEIDTEEKLSDEIRLKYRFLDLRRDNMQKSLFFRDRVLFEIRRYLHEAHFVDVDTPVLTKSTPEGARDYLVPSRMNRGQFFALPQSPQLFKQLLMVSGFDRYYQIAKCFRDEDLRSDRQPEFTQLDMEMSFVQPQDIYSTFESLLKRVFKSCLDKELTVPFRRIRYEEAMARFGTDKPDLRYDLSITDLSEVFGKTELNIFKSALAAKGVILAIHVAKPAHVLARKEFDDLIQYAKDNGASGLAYLKVTDNGIESPLAKFLKPEEVAAMKTSFHEKFHPGDLVFFAADERLKAQTLLGLVRQRLASIFKLANDAAFSFAWVDEFPLFKWNEDNQRWDSEHHPFTSPHPDDISKLGKDNGNIRSLSYDLVLNGNEIASGSIRIHDSKVQEKIFQIIGLDSKEAKSRFGFLLRAFKYGPPPHGGIALGLDRILMILKGRESIRDVIAFPKTQKAVCPLTDAPSPVSPVQLKELGLKVA